MIKEVSLKGFKSFYEETLRISQLTVLTGLNSSGKSSVMQALRMLERHYYGKNPILTGHGTVEELKNSFYGEPYSIEATYDYNGKDFYVGIGGKARTSEEIAMFPRIIYISADRFGPRTSIPIDASHELGSRGENVLKCIDYYANEEINHHLHHEDSEGDTFEYNVRAWLNAISPGVKFKSEIHTMADMSYSLFDGHRAMNVGFGLSYTLPIIVALFIGTMEKNTIVMIENPEAHLHPKGQTEMARLICSAVDAGVQVLVETHSDHLYDGIRIYAKQHSGFATKVGTHWFELDSHRLTHVESPMMDDDGNLDQWPAGMFDQFGINTTILLS